MKKEYEKTKNGIKSFSNGITIKPDNVIKDSKFLNDAGKGDCIISNNLSKNDFDNHCYLDRGDYINTTDVIVPSEVKNTYESHTENDKLALTRRTAQAVGPNLNLNSIK